MFKKIFIYTPLLCFAVITQAQTKHRYKDIIYQGVSVEKDQSYNPTALKNDKKAYLFDLYHPTGDDAKHRPLIIWMHGGGFKFGSKSADGVELWSKTFTQRGYVCASINYRLSKKNPLFHFDELQKSSYYAVQDVKLAVAYFKKNAVRYGIDPDKIILAGNSAGGIIAIQAAYSSNEELAKMTGLSDDGAAVNFPNVRVKVAAVINFWGAIYNLDWLKNTKVPIVSCLGSNDSIILPTHKSALLYGGEDIHAKADALGIPNDLKVFEGYSHELQKHFDPLFSVGKGTKKRWLEAGQFSADFLYKNVIE